MNLYNIMVCVCCVLCVHLPLQSLRHLLKRAGNKFTVRAPSCVEEHQCGYILIYDCIQPDNVTITQVHDG